MPRDWNASSYEQVSAPMEAMGRDVLDRLELRGDERVLDAGCGTGRVTAALVERLPDGEVVAVDGSPSMVEAVSRRLGPTVDARVADLTELQLERPVDAILSTATFHWIADHERLFARLYAALAPGGRLVAQCGGEGNIAAIVAAAQRAGAREPFRAWLGGWADPKNFQPASATAERLRRAGFTDVWTWLSRTTVEPDDPHEFLKTVTLGSHLERLPEEHHDAFVDAVIEELDDPGRMAYVRLNILARRPL
jgi:trans-aconitate 2-methyltransferase